MPQAIAIPIYVTAAHYATAVAIAAIWNAIVISVIIGQISKVLVKKPKVHTPPINVTVRNPVENRRVVFGTTRVGGSFLFYDVSGDKNKYLWYVIAVAGHQVSAIKDVWLDTQRVLSSQIAADGAVNAGVFAGKLWVYKHLGTANQNVDAALDSAFPEWTPSHRCRGIAYIVVKMEHDPEKYPQGAPVSVTSLLDGALLYDSRKDSTNGGSGTHRRTNPSTWEFGSGAIAIGRNPALQARWVISGGSVHNDKTTRLVMYGLRELDARIPDDYFSIAANTCDETLTGANAPPSGSQPRYRCDIELSTGETRREWLEEILETMAGAIVPVHGKYRIYAGSYDTPVHAFTHLDLYGQLEVEDTVDHERRYNAVAGVYRKAGKEWAEQTTIFRTDAAYETQDGGRRIPIEIGLRGVTDEYQAQRLCEIKLRKSRMMRTVTLNGALNLLRVAPYETLTFTHERYSWFGRTFRCLERKIEFPKRDGGAGAGRVVLTCQREDAAVYADMLTADYLTGTSDTDVFRNEIPYPPRHVKTTGTVNAFLVEYLAPVISFPVTTFEAQISTAKEMTSPTTIYTGPDLQFSVPRTSTAAAYIQVRTVRNGQYSDWVPATNGVKGQATSISTPLSASVAPGVVESSTGAASQTTVAAVVTALGGTAPYTHAWTWLTGGSGITITSASSLSTTFGATGLTTGQVRTGTAKCTVTDNVSATYVVEVDVTITRPPPQVYARAVEISGFAIAPANASCAFRFDSDGHIYISQNSGSPTEDHGLWCDPVEYTADFQIRVTRTGGSETAFTSGPALGTWLAMTADREWRLTETSDLGGDKDIVWTLEIRRASDSALMGLNSGQTCQVRVETTA